MQPRTLLILAIVVASLLAFIWFFEREMPSSEERRALANRVVRFEPDEIDELTLEIGGRTVRMERPSTAPDGEGDADDGDDVAARSWRLVEPFAGPADQQAVEDLLAGLTGLESTRRLSDVGAAEAGLDPPRARIVLAAAGERREILVGGQVPASSSLILGVEGAEVLHVVDGALWDELDRDPGDWRSREVFPGERSDVARVAASAGGERLLLARRGGSFWVESPFVDRADQEYSDELLSALTDLRIDRFLDELPAAPEDLGLEPPRGSVEAVLEGREEPFLVELGSPVPDGEGRIFARLGDQVFETETELAGALDRPIESWRSRSWSALESYQVDRAAIRGEWGEVELSREGPDWLRDGVEISFGPASEFLYALADIEADRVVASRLEADLQEAPAVEIDLSSDSEEEGLDLYAAGDEEWIATVDSRQVVLYLSASAVEQLRARLEAVLAAEAVAVEDPPPAE